MKIDTVFMLNIFFFLNFYLNLNLKFLAERRKKKGKNKMKPVVEFVDEFSVERACSDVLPVGCFFFWHEDGHEHDSENYVEVLLSSYTRTEIEFGSPKTV